MAAFIGQAPPMRPFDDMSNNQSRFVSFSCRVVGRENVITITDRCALVLWANICFCIHSMIIPNYVYWVWYVFKKQF